MWQVHITEGSTLTDSGSITFTDLDLTDTPTATEVTKSVTTALTLTAAQQAAIENAFSISPDAGNTNNGTINWDYTITEGELDFLAAGETVTVVYTITVDDANGGTDTQDVTVTITGANDAPVIAVVDVAGAITEGTTLTDAGSITFTDLDLTDTPDGHRGDQVRDHGTDAHRRAADCDRECLQHQPRCRQHQQRHHQLGLHHHGRRARFPRRGRDRHRGLHHHG